ncbi:hypothetical protein H072_188 [Dactylellina haptotyla CBS 200.50]|uniref:RRM domain-containing protein n=1 Tax=Dactylellina haptotyla (strain CBS 200.50) TaxID=1284197 RepID=S8C2D1_DACHA|nr:hypothetical protein H072_188 [Dactylellina haptotyla CBS 200.50]
MSDNLATSVVKRPKLWNLYELLSKDALPGYTDELFSSQRTLRDGIWLARQTLRTYASTFETFENLENPYKVPKFFRDITNLATLPVIQQYHQELPKIKHAGIYQLENPRAWHPPRRNPIISEAERPRPDDLKVHRPARQEDSPETAAAIAEGRRIYLGNLLYTTTPDNIETFLSSNGFPNFERIHISIDPFNERNPGYCFVEFKEKVIADEALEKLEGVPMFDRLVKCRPCQPKGGGNWDRSKTTPTSTGRLSTQNYHVSKAQEEGRQLYGISKRISPRESTTEERRNFCFVDFSTREQAQAAREIINGIIYRDYPLKITEAVPRATRDERLIRQAERATSRDIRFGSYAVPLTSNGTVATVEATSANLANVAEIKDAPWYLAKISAKESDKDVWKLKGNGTYYHDARSGAGVDAYVIDSSFYPQHPDFDGRMTMLEGGAVAANGTGHGTAVASILGGSKYGVARKVNIIACAGHANRALPKIIKLHNAKKADQKKYPGFAGSVINISSIWWPEYLKKFTPKQQQEVLKTEHKLIQDAIKAGIHITIAAGNQGSGACSGVPQRFYNDTQGMIVVGATAKYGDSDSNDKKLWPGTNRPWPRSNFGKCVDIYAPGDWLNVATAPPKNYRSGSGTSFSAPVVAGVIAELMVRHPNLSKDPVAMKKFLLGKSREVVEGKGNAQLRFLYNGIHDA